MRSPRAFAATTGIALAMVLLVSGCASRPSPAVGDAPGGADAADPVPAVKVVYESAAVKRQLTYALAHFADKKSKKYGNLGGTDCVNFASQTLLARGWKMDNEWWQTSTDGSFDYGSAWISSTAMMKYIAQRPNLATALTDKQRDKVAIGDIAQFDYDNSGDRDHTAVVSQITHEHGATQIFVVQHSVGDDYRSVDTMLTKHGDDAHVYYWHLKK